MNDQLNRNQRRRKRKWKLHEDRRVEASNVLTAAGIPFRSLNGGVHLILDEHFTADGQLGAIDFWPGTELWIVRPSGERGKGLQPLLERLR